MGTNQKCTSISNLDQFLTASEVLTGFDQFDLQGTGQAQAYYEFVVATVGEAIVHELGHLAQSLSENGVERDSEVQEKILTSDKFGPFARSLMKLWYLGSWDALPSEWLKKYGEGEQNRTGVLSSQSYKEGLVWQAIGAHPMGAKQQGFGAWSLPPETLQ